MTVLTYTIYVLDANGAETSSADEKSGSAHAEPDFLFTALLQPGKALPHDSFHVPVFAGRHAAAFTTYGCYSMNLKPTLAVKPFEYTGFEGSLSAVAPVPMPPASMK